MFSRPLSATEFSFDAFALNRRFSKIISKQVLGTVTSAMTTVANDGDDHLLVFFVASENFFKAICHGEEFFLQTNFALKQFGFNIDLQIVGSVNS